MDINEQKRKINNFMLTFSEYVYGVRKNPFDIIGEYLSQLLEAPKIYQFMYNTKYSSYRDAVLRIVERIYSKGYNTKIAEFSQNISDEEFLGHFQHTRIINMTNLEYLDNIQSDVTKTVIDKYISIYDDLSGNLEKYVRLLIWIDKLFGGEIPDYTKIKKGRLANHIGHLHNQPIFKDLLEPFNITIRNAISHKGSVLIDPILESITFINTNKQVVKSYQEFLNETRELAAAWSIISNIGFIISLYGVRKLFSRTDLFNNPK
jgi:hypothetical protein